MERLNDKLFILLVTSVVYILSGVDKWAVCGLLFAVIYMSINIVFNKRAVYAALNVVFMIWCIVNPKFMYLAPIYVYDNIKYERYIWEVALIFPIITMKEKPTIYVSFCVFAAIAAIASAKNDRYINKIHELQDTISEINNNIEASQRETIETQNYKIHAATLVERNRIAREIHDNVGHMITRAILQTGALKVVCKDENIKENIAGLNETLNNAMNSIRSSVHDLRDESFDLEQMLRDIIKEYSEKIYITLDYDMSIATSKNVKYAFAAIVKEAVTNTIKHSNADRIEIVVREHPGFYQLLIQDNGVNLKLSDNEGMGLDNMKERVKALNGNIVITKENGFKIFVTIMK